MATPLWWPHRPSIGINVPGRVGSVDFAVFSADYQVAGIATMATGAGCDSVVDACRDRNECILDTAQALDPPWDMHAPAGTQV
jgi:hypothetical protein